MERYTGLGMRYRPRGIIGHETVIYRLFPSSFAILASVCQPFTLIKSNDLYHAFT